MEPSPETSRPVPTGRRDPAWLVYFAAWLQAKGYARSSRESYLISLRAIHAWLEAQGWEPARLVDPEVLELYGKDWERSHPASRRASRLQIRNSVRCWLRYARETGLVPPLPPRDPETRPLKTRPWLEPFERHLRREGYRRAIIQRHLERLAQVGDFLADRNLRPPQLAEPETLELYIREWAANATAGPASRTQIRGAVRRWLDYARANGIVAPLPAVAEGPPLVEDYLLFAETHQGLSASSRREHRRWLVALADFTARHGHPELVDIPLSLLDSFVAGGRGSRDEVTRVARSVRSFLSYLFLMGHEPRDRSRWIDTPRRYRNERLPRHLSDAQLEQALAQVDRNSAHGKKVWAVLALLTNYGLRVGEVACLRLDDVDLEGCRLRVMRSKTRQESVYPLTPAVEEALRDYLGVRPASEHLEVFLTSRAPHRPYAGGGCLVGPCVRAILARVVGNRGCGGHVLRHTLARRLRQAGVSLPLMRQILGHKSSTSTGCYLRIALDELREVANNYANLL